MFIDTLLSPGWVEYFIPLLDLLLRQMLFFKLQLVLLEVSLVRLELVAMRLELVQLMIFDYIILGFLEGAGELHLVAALSVKLREALV